MMIVNTNDGETVDSPSAEAASLKVLQAQQQAWKNFAERATHMIPVLKAQMFAVTQETERAALDLMVHLRLLSSSEIQALSNDRTESVSKVVMALQFQDITRQKLEHIGTALDQLNSHLQILVKGPLDEEGRRAIAELEAIEQHYTMEDERRLHHNALRPNYEEPVPTGLSDERADSVMLF